MLAQRLGDGQFDLIQRLVLPGGARGYRFERNGTWWLAVWHEDDVLQMPGEVETPVDVVVPLPADVASVDVTAAITQGSTATTQSVAAANSEVTLSLTSVPIFVEATP